MTLSPMDLPVHDLILLCATVVVLTLVSQLIVAALLRTSNRFLRSQGFEEVTGRDRDTFRRRLRSRAFLVMRPIDLALLIGASVARPGPGGGVQMQAETLPMGESSRRRPVGLDGRPWHLGP